MASHVVLFLPPSRREAHPLGADAPPPQGGSGAKGAAWGSFLRCLCLPALALALGGCAGLSYSWQAVRGHAALLQAARPLDAVLADPATPVPLRERLLLAQSARRFASEELGLPDNDSYTAYADVGRPYVVWNVFATPAFSLRLTSSCFPVVGCIDYRGYYREADARAAAAELAGQGWDVHVGGVPAYSTLGWYADPLVNTFIRLPPGEVARLIFHELTHQAVYIRDDTSFNESLATVVEQIGTARWLAAREADAPACAGEGGCGAGEDGRAAAMRRAYEEYRRRHADFIALLLETRAELQALYAAERVDPSVPRDPGLDAGRRERLQAGKQAAIDALRRRHAALKAGAWGGFSGYDAWLAQDLNNAHFAAVATYHRWVPALRALARRHGAESGSLQPFLAEARALGRLPRAEREGRLEAMSPR